MGVEVVRETTRMKAATKQHSRRLQREMTDAEKLLWRHLRMEQFDGYKFRRQHPLGNFIVDFVCLDAALILEVDGGQHADNSDSDDARTHWLQGKGFHVLRFWNNEVMGNIEGVKLAIWNYLKGVEALHAAGGDSKFLPPPRPSGETPSHSTRRANDARQVAGYPCKGEGVKK